MNAGLVIEVHTRGAPQPLPPSRWQFPDPRGAGRTGLLGAGADFAPETIVAAYRAGVFPWPHPDEELLWFSPDPRAILPLGGLHVSRRLARTIRQGRFRVTVDAAFAAVVDGCANRDDGTWITPGLRDAYVRLHDLGWAHSVETWTADGQLAGGLYGIGVGAMYGAESMFFRVTDASKVALAGLMAHAANIGLELIDIQVLTPHTARLGAIEVPRAEYLRRLSAALEREASWWRVDGGSL